MYDYNRKNSFSMDNNKIQWGIGCSVALATTVVLLVLGQTGYTGANISEGQYLLAMLVTIPILLMYYFCTSATPKPVLVQGCNFDPLCSPQILFSPSYKSGGYEGNANGSGDTTSQQQNTPFCCPPSNFGTANSCQVPSEAPCVAASDERRMKIRWDRRIDCPRHIKLRLKGDYPFNPVTPNWQNRQYVDENARLWYQTDTGMAPVREGAKGGEDRADTWRTGAKMSAIPGEVGMKNVGGGGIPFMKGGGGGKTMIFKNRSMANRAGGGQQLVLYNQPEPTPPRFRAPQLSYVPKSDDSGTAQSFSFMPFVPMDSNLFAVAPLTTTATRRKEEEEEGRIKSVIRGNWQVILVCVFLIVLHRCYQSIYDSGEMFSPLDIIGRNPSQIVESIKKDATFMVTLLSLACVVMFVLKRR